MAHGEIIGAQGEIIGDGFVGREEIVGDGFVGDEEIYGDGGRMGGTMRLHHSLATDLPHGPETSYALVAGRATDLRRAHGERRPGPSRIELLGRPALAIVGTDPARAAAETREAAKLHRRLMKRAEATREVDASDVDAVVGCLNRARAFRTGRPMTVAETQAAKGEVLADLSDRDAVVRGECVSGVGDFISSLVSVPTAVVSKGLELGTRMAVGTGKALFTIPYGAVKSTFFKGSGKKKAATAQDDGGDGGDSLPTMARRIARKKAEIARRRRDLQSRIDLADAKQKLAETEADEEAQLAEMEAEAASKEEEAKAALQGASVGGDDGARALVKWARMRGDAVENRVAQATVRAAGPFAKAMILNSPVGKFFKFAQQVYKEARTDPRAGEKIAKLKEQADQGHPGAQQAINVLALGKAASADAAAAQTVNRELAQQVAAEAASSSGASSWVAGLLPSSERLIAAAPGAREVYDLARAGNETALSSVRRAAEIVRAAEAGDESARSKVQMLGRLAAGGDKAARVVLAAIAVATAGIREEAHSARVRGEAAAAPVLRVAAAAAPGAGHAPTLLERVFGRDLGGGHLYETGLAIKLAQRRS